jgi:hypothetical protein
MTGEASRQRIVMVSSGLPECERNEEGLKRRCMKPTAWVGALPLLVNFNGPAGTFGGA